MNSAQWTYAVTGHTRALLWFLIGAYFAIFAVAIHRRCRKCKRKPSDSRSFSVEEF